MKKKIEVEAGWLQKSSDIALHFGLSGSKELQARDECAKELMWFLSSSITENDLENRISKYERLYSNDAVNATKFDPYWRERLEFLMWIKE
jgi:hypothetical protein